MAADPEVWIEYPKDGEVVTHPHYSFQVCACPAAMSVAVSIDAGPWQPCRESMGLWWFDWSGYVDGAHELVARIDKARDGVIVCAPRRFSVKLK